MKILCITDFDIDNIPFANILKVLKEKKHEIHIFSSLQGENHLRMFEGIGEPIKKLDDLTEDEIEDCDCIITAKDIPEQIMDYKKYVFTYSSHAYDKAYPAGDFTFYQRKMGEPICTPIWQTDLVNLQKVQPSIAVGNPKFDTLFRDDASNTGEYILFVDSGHFPFGHRAKHELAKTLVDMALKYPEEQFIIKPRFLPGDKKVTHRNEDYLYDHIETICKGSLPENLVLLQEHVDLEELTAHCKTMITTYTSSYFDALMAEKGLIIMDGLPHEYTIFFSTKHIQRFYQIMSASGCVVPYTEAIDHLPAGKKVKEGYLERWVYDYKSGKISDHIVECIEYIYTNYIQFDKFPALQNYEYATYQQELSCDDTIGWKELIHRRYKMQLYMMTCIEFHIQCEIDLQPFIDFVEGLSTQGIYLNKDNYHTYKNKCVNILYQILLEKYDDVMQYPVDQSYLFLYMFLQDRERFKKIKAEDVVCTEYYSLLMGKMLADEDGILAEKYLDRYFDGIKDNLWEKTPADFGDNICSAHFYMGKVCYSNQKTDKAKYHFERCLQLTNGCHKAAEEYLLQIKGTEC